MTLLRRLEELAQTTKTIDIVDLEAGLYTKQIEPMQSFLSLLPTIITYLRAAQTLREEVERSQLAGFNASTLRAIEDFSLEILQKRLDQALAEFDEVTNTAWSSRV